MLVFVLIEADPALDVVDIGVQLLLKGELINPGCQG